MLAHVLGLLDGPQVEFDRQAVPIKGLDSPLGELSSFVRLIVPFDRLQVLHSTAQVSGCVASFPGTYICQVHDCECLYRRHVEVGLWQEMLSSLFQKTFLQCRYVNALPHSVVPTTR